MQYLVWGTGEEAVCYKQTSAQYNFYFNILENKTATVPIW